MHRSEIIGDIPVHILGIDDAPRPIVLMFMDAVGIRPGLLDLARQIAGTRYQVLVPDLFYRFGPYGPLDPGEVLAGDFRATLGPMMATTDHDRVVEDIAGIIAWLDTQPAYAKRPLGAVGFCLGGGFALTAAARFPGRISAVASFHGGHLATDQPASPHRLVSAISAQIYVASAADDPVYPPEMAMRLDEALGKAGAIYSTEPYPAHHGWMVPDHPAHDALQAKRGLAALSGLLDGCLS